MFNYQLSKLDPNLFNEKLDKIFEKLDCAAKVNIALGLELLKIETCEHRCYYAHEINTLFGNYMLILLKQT